MFASIINSNTNNMKAIECTKYRSPEVLRLKEFQKPQPKKDEVLIKINPTSAFALVFVFFVVM